MEKVLDSIKDAMTLQDDKKLQTSIMSSEKELEIEHEQHPAEDNGEDDIPGPSGIKPADVDLGITPGNEPLDSWI